MTKNRRLFIALELPDPIKETLLNVQRQLQQQSFFNARYIKSEQLHLTLLFLGSVENEKLLLIQRQLRTIRYAPFNACLGSLGYFPQEKYFRIIWIALRAPELQPLAIEMSNAVRPFVLLEERDFSSHVTLARVTKVVDRSAAISFIESIIPLPDCFTVTEFVLKESVLSSDGPDYLDIERYSF